MKYNDKYSVTVYRVVWEEIAIIVVLETPFILDPHDCFIGDPDVFMADARGS